MAIGLTLGLGSLVGGLASATGSIFGANKSADIASANTAKQIAWEKERAKNAHQWEVQDLEAAGINPILSAGGSGATTGGISPQLPDTNGYGRAGEAIDSILSKAIQYENMQTNTAKTKAEIDNINEQTGLIQLQRISEGIKHGLMKKETALKELERLIKGKDLNYYDEKFKNEMSYKMYGTHKFIMDLIQSELNKYGINETNLKKLGTKLFEGKTKTINSFMNSAKKTMFNTIPYSKPLYDLYNY